MTVRKIFIRFCKNIESFVMKSINVQGGFLFCAGWNFLYCMEKYRKKQTQRLKKVFTMTSRGLVIPVQPPEALNSTY